MSARRAVILLRPGPENDRQLAATVPHVQRVGHHLVGIVPAVSGQEAVAMVGRGTHVRNGRAWHRRAAALVVGAGGALEAVYRDDPGRISVPRILATLYRDEGWPVARIAQRFNMDPRDVAANLPADAGMVGARPGAESAGLAGVVAAHRSAARFSMTRLPRGVLHDQPLPGAGGGGRMRLRRGGVRGSQ